MKVCRNSGAQKGIEVAAERKDWQRVSVKRTNSYYRPMTMSEPNTVTLVPVY